MISINLLFDFFAWIYLVAFTVFTRWDIMTTIYGNSNKDDGIVGTTKNNINIRTNEILSSSSSFTCMTDFDCSLNGECNKLTSKCICDKGWNGIDCGTLNLNPIANVAYGYTETSNVSSWGGGPPVYDPITKKYHLFVSEIAGNCGMSTWSRMSTTVQTISDRLEGPYERVKTIFSTVSHNVYYVYSEIDQMHILYTIFESISPRSCNPYYNCTNGTTPGSRYLYPPEDWTPMTCKDGRGMHANIHYSKSLNGPWESAGPIVPDFGPNRTTPRNAGTSNPAPYIFPNGTVLLIGRGKDANRLPNGTIQVYHNIFLYRANSWNDTYYWIPSDGPDGALNVGLGEKDAITKHPLLTEDPTFYRGRRGFHILFHTHPNLSHGYSLDGINNWKWSKQIIGPPNHVPESGGGADNERPRVVVDKNGDLEWVFVGQMLGIGGDAARTAAFKTLPNLRSARETI